jgi:hypothetical protein
MEFYKVLSLKLLLVSDFNLRCPLQKKNQTKNDFGKETKPTLNLSLASYERYNREYIKSVIRKRFNFE